jgi:hypothetical protein
MTKFSIKGLIMPGLPLLSSKKILLFISLLSQEKVGLKQSQEGTLPQAG